MGDDSKSMLPRLFTVHRWREMNRKAKLTKIHTASVTQNHIPAQDTADSIPVHREILQQRARDARWGVVADEPGHERERG